MPQLASLVFFYFGDSSRVTLAQEAVPLHLATDGYDHSVVLRHDTRVGMFDVAERGDVTAAPTRIELARQLSRLTEEGYDTDLYVFSHGSPGGFRVSRGTRGDDDVVTADWLREHVARARLRMVWQANCYGASLNQTWLDLGARAAVGARGVNFYPTRFNRFARLWSRRRSTVAHAAVSCDLPASRALSEAWILADAMGRHRQWSSGLVEASRVLHRCAAAQAYFRSQWDLDEYDPRRSGRQNMRAASELVVSGVRGLRWDS